MRVIAGTFRSRPLRAPRGSATRPTSDRLRETLFSVLGPRVPGSCFADLYAGSGAVGIEAVSRGASQVYFAEKATAAVQAIRANLRTLGIHAGTEVEPEGTAALLRRLHAKRGGNADAATVADAGGAGGVLDVVFLDPPYDAAEDYRKTLLVLGSGGLLRTGAVVVAEHARRESLLPAYGGLVLTRTLLQGDAALSFYAEGTAAAGPAEDAADTE